MNSICERCPVQVTCLLNPGGTACLKHANENGFDAHPTNADVLSEALRCFYSKESDEQGYVADYINCPNVNDCEYDGEDNEYCIDCKIKWLLEKWRE